MDIENYELTTRVIPGPDWLTFHHISKHLLFTEINYALKTGKHKRAEDGLFSYPQYPNKILVNTIKRNNSGETFQPIMMEEVKGKSK